MAKSVCMGANTIRDLEFQNEPEHELCEATELWR